MSVELLSHWRCKALAAQGGTNGDPTPAFVPVVLKDGALDQSSVWGPGVIETALADAVIRVKGAVDAAALS